MEFTETLEEYRRAKKSAVSVPKKRNKNPEVVYINYSWVPVVNNVVQYDTRGGCPSFVFVSFFNKDK